ncbi:MAG: aminodeoxychorismate/anthranilate synthase component II, partial [Acidobacteria bacterium]|nr:aminodeoxychorismate/anthranilate synthase component II [Acidobacteriota bacterium]
MTFLLDNYDSFTYNLAQYLGELGERVVVRRNDQVTLADIERMQPDRIVISPGPGTPDTAGLTLELIRRFAGRLPILGVCLGHQAIGQAFGGRVVPAPSLMHGKTSPILHDARTVFRGLPQRFEATRYHSLVVSRQGFPRRELEV